MTDQEAFEKAARHLLTQKKVAIEGGKSLYRTSDGRRCAIGALIPDDEYSRDFEGETVASIRDKRRRVF